MNDEFLKLDGVKIHIFIYKFDEDTSQSLELRTLQQMTLNT